MSADGIVTAIEPGDFSCSFTALNDSNISGSCNGSVNDPPSAFIEAIPKTGIAPLTVTLDGGQSFDLDGGITSFWWEESGKILDPGVIILLPPDPVGSIDTTFASAGTYTVQLFVFDNDNGMDSVSIDIIVSAPPPPPPPPPPPAQTEVYVSTIGSDSNPGTIAQPMLTLGGAIARAAAIGAETINMAGGEYSINANIFIDLNQKLTLNGGFSNDFLTRDFNVYETKLIDTRSGGTPSSNITTVHVGADTSGTGSSTILNGASVVNIKIDGLTINGASGYAIALNLTEDNIIEINQSVINGGSSGTETTAIKSTNSSSPAITNSTINGGGGGSSRGIRNDNSSPTIQNSTINGGSGSLESYGIHNDNSSPTIQDSTINGGSGGFVSYGIYNAFSAPIIQNNTINGGSGPIKNWGIYNTSGAAPMIQNNLIFGGGGTTESIGIYNLGNSTAIIRNNTINGGENTGNSYGIRLSINSAPTIENNIIFTSGGGSEYCIYEDFNGSLPVSVRNNDLFSCPDAFYTDADGFGNLTLISDVNDFNKTTQSAGSPSSGNASDDPTFVDIDGADDIINTMADNDWHLGPSSTTSVTLGGLDLSSSFTTDKDGVPRTVPWSIGAYEKD